MGYPIEDVNESYTKYSSEIFNALEKNNYKIDTVFIDGRFRVACTLKSIEKFYNNKDLRIIIHDFWNREHYHIVLNYLDVVDKVDTLGVFKIKENINFDKLKNDYDEYKNNPK